MALIGKLGSILRQTTPKQIKSDVFLSNPSIYQMMRCMSSKLFVGGLSYSTDEQGLWEAFGKYGQVTDAKVIMDRETGRSRGFGFVTLSNAEEASSAIQAIDQKELHGRIVKVNYATERAPRGPIGGYGGNGYYNQNSYGGGGYGGQDHGGSGYDQTHGGGYGTQGYGSENQAYAPPTQSDGSAGNFQFSGGNNSYADPINNGYNASIGESNARGGTDGAGGDFGETAEGYSGGDDLLEGLPDRRG